jgi:hypothetical protein
MGRHAVAVTGFGVRLGGSPEAGRSGFLSEAGAIDRIYAHDDQVGPFSRMLLDGLLVTPAVVQNNPGLFSLSTNWKTDSISMGSVRAVPDTVLIPLYHKIRIPFSRIEDAVIAFDAVLEQLRPAALRLFTTRLVWRVHLTTVNDLKAAVFADSSLDPRLRQSFLTKNLPRFMWKAVAYHGEKAVLELLFDATDIEQGRLFVTAIEYDPLLSGVLRNLAHPSVLDPVLAVLESSLGPLRSVRDILQQFRN